MRITTGLLTDNYVQNLQRIQNRKFAQELKLTTLKDINSLADDPKKVINIKELSAMVSKNEQYLTNLNEVHAELTVAHDQLQSFADKAQNIRQLSIDATQTGSAANTSSIGSYVKGLIEDMVKDLNTSFNGKFIFGGTKTTEESMNSATGSQTNFPYEVITEAPTTDNPSGMKVVFKGNFNERIVNKDSNATETVNVTMDKVMGTDGTKVFDPVIKLYNLLVYKKDGVARGANDYFNKDDVQTLSSYQKTIAENYDLINNNIAKVGAKVNRIEVLQDQMTEQNSRLRAFKSLDEDADVAKTTMELSKESSVLQYSLQVGSKMLSQSLFDFLA